MLFDFWLHALHLAIRHDLCANTSAAFQHSEHDSFVRTTSTSDALFTLAEVHVPRFPTNEGFVHFDFAAEFATEEIILHRKPDTMQHEPCRLLSDLHVAGNLVAANSVLAVGDQPSCGHPLVERNSGIFHDGSN